MCFLLCAGLCFSTMNPRSTFSIWAAGRRADRMPREQNAISTEQIFPVHLLLYSTYGCDHFFFFSSQLHSPDPAPRSDVYFGRGREGKKKKKKILRSKNTVMLSRKGGGACQLLTTPPGKTEEMVLACDPGTCAHICKGNKTSSPGPAFLNLALHGAV